MNCHICDKSTKVYDVRQRKKARVRRRVCLAGHAFLTYEVNEDRFNELLKYETLFLRIQNIVEKED
ncbi:hypothetical protein J7E79_02815 [Bacillus sp. ISL-40]|uniref:NrdR family transcriptional regulator n=1 Tax=Bacillus sp. ISL-40 TaxID=2819126 RepID=UPI001BED3277|nr:hypothetical protein [Bacillus sp. ISL-40]MBT2696368.1 hypothetical protein [Bacillus sp. ISL-40]